MATRVIRIEVCDICGAEEKLTKFRITERGGASKGITLCADKDHGAPVIRDITARAVKQPSVTRGRPGKVSSMNEVAAARGRRAKKGA